MINYTIDDLKLILNNVSLLLKFTAYLYFIPVFIILFYGEPGINLILYFTLALVHISLHKLLTFKSEKKGELKHAILTVGLFWIIFNMLACLPIVAVENVSFVDAYFNTVSATTTTGLTIEPDLGNYSYSSIFWLLFLGWIGGVGIIVLAFLGVFFSYNKFRLLANAEGHDEKFKSNIKSTILSIWIIYSIATLIGIIALRLCGLPLFDAICYAFTAISTTGTDINSVGLLGYGSIWALIVTLIIGLFGSLSFITHYLFFVRRKFKAYMEDPEFLTMFSVFFLVIAFVSLKYMKLVPFSDLYHIISAGTGGTSLHPANVIKTWPDFLKGVIIFIMFIGGSSASTGGGIKIQRFILICKMIIWRTKEILLPVNAYFTRKYNGIKVNDVMLRNTFGYVLLYVVFILFTTTILTFYNYPFMDSLFEVTSAQTNIGIPTGIVSATLPLFPKVLFIINMLLGRLEIIPLFAIIGFFFSFSYKSINFKNVKA